MPGPQNPSSGTCCLAGLSAQALIAPDPTELGPDRCSGFLGKIGLVGGLWFFGFVLFRRVGLVWFLGGGRGRG